MSTIKFRVVTTLPHYVLVETKFLSNTTLIGVNAQINSFFAESVPLASLTTIKADLLSQVNANYFPPTVPPQTTVFRSCNGPTCVTVTTHIV